MTRSRSFGGFLACLFLLVFWPLPGRSSIDQAGDRILGLWLFPTKGSSVDIIKSGDRYFARVVEADEAGQENFGLVKNKVLISNLTYNGHLWSGGELVHPKTGIHLTVEMWLNDSQSLTVMVFKGFKCFHKKFVMTRGSV